MKTAFFALVLGISAIAPEGALAHGRHGHRGHQPVPTHLYVTPLPPQRHKPFAKEKCHWHPNKGYWHCHKRHKGHGQKMRNQPNFGIHFIIPIQ